MINAARFSLILAGVGTVSLLAASASANTATVRCVSRQDQISVYDSLSTRGVEAKLRCGEEVEIIGRVQDYVKIRAQNGVEGYVPATSFAGLTTSANHPAAPPSAASANAASVNAVPAQNTAAKKQASSAPGGPSDTFAEMNPAADPLPLAGTPAKATASVPANHSSATNTTSSASAKPPPTATTCPPRNRNTKARTPPARIIFPRMAWRPAK